MSALLSTLVHPGVVANLRWNPTFRGILFPSILFLVLCGSCYVILATNIGNRLGFLLSSAAFWGWMSLMTIAWMIYGIGLRGPDPKWVVQEAIKDTRSAQVEKVAQIPNTPTKIVPKDWKVVQEGVPMRGEAQSAIDAYLAPAPKKVDYVAISGFESGGAQRIKVWPKVVKDGKWYNPGDYAFRGLLHSKHYYVGQVQPMLTQPKKVGGVIQYDSKGVALTEAVVKDGKNVADTTKPITTVVLIRDLGSRRQPPFFIFCASFVLLLLSLFNLHRRDKQVMTAMGQLKPQGARRLMADYFPIVALLVVATLFVFGSFVASALLGPKRQETAAKIGPYECGIVPENEPAERFPVRFYLVAMIFIIFDIEIIFLYPWAVLFNKLGTFGLVEMALFSVAVIVAFVYLISNGALDWGPIARLRDLEGSLGDAVRQRSELRTSASSIRRIPREPKEAA